MHASFDFKNTQIKNYRLAILENEFEIARELKTAVKIGIIFYKTNKKQHHAGKENNKTCAAR